MVREVSRRNCDANYYCRNLEKETGTATCSDELHYYFTYLLEARFQPISRIITDTDLFFRYESAIYAGTVHQFQSSGPGLHSGPELQGPKSRSLRNGDQSFHGPSKGK